jgi:oxalate decarboxylase
VIAEQVKAAPSEETKADELEPFKYDIESEKGWVGPGGSAKEATVKQLPVSQTIAGVSMRLDPGAIRELHWHALAAEWAYVLTGRCRTTVITPNGQAEVDDFEGRRHLVFSRAATGTPFRHRSTECHFLLGFDNGHFSEFGTFSITDWIARTPRNVLARNLNLPESAFGQMPQKELYIGPGKVPPAVEDIRNSELQPSQSAHKFRIGKMPPKVFEGGEERIVTQNEFPIQTTLTAVRMDLKPGALRELHWHPHADEWQFYVKGAGASPSSDRTGA